MRRRTLFTRAASTLVVGALVVGACASDPDEGSTEPVDTGASEASIVTEPATTGGAPDTGPPSTDVPDTDVPNTEVPVTEPPTTEPAPETTAEPETELSPDEVCDVLRTDGFETRASLVADLDTDLRTAVEETCGDDLARTVAAVDLRAVADAVNEVETPVAIGDVSCSPGEYSFIARNQTDVALGVHVGLRLRSGDQEEPLGSSDYPIVIWRIEPGEAQGITGEFTPPDTGSYRCNFLGRPFLADLGPADAGLPEAVDASLTGEASETWFGSLIGERSIGIGSGDPDRAAVTEDLRSLFYDDVVEAVSGTDVDPTTPVSVVVCEGTVDQPGPDRASFVYHLTVENDDGSTTGSFHHGIFRRGSDGQWRWLTPPHYFESPDFADCAPG